MNAMLVPNSAAPDGTAALFAGNLCAEETIE